MPGNSQAAMAAKITISHDVTGAKAAARRTNPGRVGHKGTGGGT